MRSKSIGVIAAIGIAVAMFAVGVVAGSAGLIGVRVPASIGDGMVGVAVVTLWVGDTAYGARSSIPWRDAGGSEHDGGWPACLATPGEVTGVRFKGATVWHDTLGMAEILWVDCAPR